jgi:hypothetical protein
MALAQKSAVSGRGVARRYFFSGFGLFNAASGTLAESRLAYGPPRMLP